MQKCVLNTNVAQFLIREVKKRYIFVRFTPTFANIQISCYMGLLGNLMISSHNNYRFDIILKFRSLNSSSSIYRLKVLYLSFRFAALLYTFFGNPIFVTFMKIS